MTRAYDELSSLFARFYSRRGESGSVLLISVGACHSALQVLYTLSLVNLLVWLGIACIDFERRYIAAFAICLPTAFLNYLFLQSPSRRSPILTPSSGRQLLGKAVAVGGVVLVIASVLLYRGSISGIPARLDLVAVCTR